MKVGHVWNTWTTGCAVENEMLFVLGCYSQSFLIQKHDHIYDSQLSVSLPDGGFSAFAINKLH